MSSLDLDELAAIFALGVLPGEAVASAEAAEGNLAALCYYGRLRLPFAVDEVVHRVVCGLGLHVTREDAADRRLARRAAVVDDVPPRDAVHLLDREPRTVAVAHDDRLHHLSLWRVVRRGDGDDRPAQIGGLRDFGAGQIDFYPGDPDYRTCQQNEKQQQKKVEQQVLRR